MLCPKRTPLCTAKLHSKQNPFYDKWLTALMVFKMPEKARKSENRRMAASWVKKKKKMGERQLV
jgi:hypothetical protein